MSLKNMSIKNIFLKLRSLDPSQYAWILGKRKGSIPTWPCIPCCLYSTAVCTRLHVQKADLINGQATNTSKILVLPRNWRKYRKKRIHVRPLSFYEKKRWYDGNNARYDGTVNAAGHNLLSDRKSRRIADDVECNLLQSLFFQESKTLRFNSNLKENRQAFTHFHDFSIESCTQE